MTELTLFVSGAALMTLELTASRILSPYVGSSIYVWTAIIGVIMGALSLGYYWGGKLADKKAETGRLAALLFATGLSVVVCYLLREFVLLQTVQLIRDTRVSSTIISLVLFALPSFLFGTITPYATRIKLQKLNNSGEVVGKLYAISTLGSIAGTFLTGYFLLGYFGSNVILLIVAAATIILSVLLSPKSFFRLSKLLILLFFSLLALYSHKLEKGHYVYEADSNYQKIFIYDASERNTGRPIRLLRTSILSQSGRFLDGDDLLFEYIRQLTLVGHFKPDTQNILFIGGGGYSLPSYFVNKFPEITADVVELDPKVSMAARKYFNVPVTDRLTTIDSDGRSYVNSTGKIYDVIVLDAYRDEMIMPFELVSSEAFEKYSQILSDDGVLAINNISSLTGSKSDFLRAEYKTIRKYFDQVLIFRPQPKRAESAMQNIVVFAFKKGSEVSLKSDNTNYQDLLDNLWQGNLDTQLPELTDNYSPIERFMLAGF